MVDDDAGVEAADALLGEIALEQQLSGPAGERRIRADVYQLAFDVAAVFGQRGELRGEGGMLEPELRVARGDGKPVSTSISAPGRHERVAVRFATGRHVLARQRDILADADQTPFHHVHEEALREGPRVDVGQSEP